MFEEIKIRYLLGISLLFLLVTGIVLMIIQPNIDFAISALYLVVYVAIPVVFFRYHFRRQNISIREFAYFNGVKRWIPSIFGIVFVSITFSLGSFWLFLFLLNPLLPSFIDFLLGEVPMPTNVFYLTIEIICITILAPIVEELIFRGVILHRLIRKTSLWGGILISSLLFGILHANLLGAFLFGIIASLLFIKTKNLLIPILVHMVNNTTAVVFMFIAPTWPEWLHIFKPADIAEKALPNALLLIVSSVLIGLILFRLGKGLSLKVEDNSI